MKIIIPISKYLLILLIISSCSKEKESINFFTYGNQKTNLNDGLIRYNGNYGTGNDHFIYDISLLDGTLYKNNDGEFNTNDSNLFLELSLICPSNKNIVNGHYVFENNIDQASLEDQLILVYAILAIDNNNNGEFEEVEDGWVYLNDGSVDISFNNNKYSISFSLEMTNGKQISRNFEGSLYVDGTH